MPRPARASTPTTWRFLTTEQKVSVRIDPQNPSEPTAICRWKVLATTRGKILVARALLLTVLATLLVASPAAQGASEVVD